MSNLTKGNKPSDLTVNKPNRDAGSDIAAFAERSRALKATAVKKQGRGRLIFGMDATGSRQPSWDMAVELQADMFREITNLDVQLVFYRADEKPKFSAWVSDPQRLANSMRKVSCIMGMTQIGKVLKHACDETKKTKVAAVVFVGDAFEEGLDELAPIARELGRLGTPTFMFQETNVWDKDKDAEVAYAFQQIAELTNGAYCRFDAGAARQLAELLRTVAAYAAGNKALAVKPSVAGWLSYFA